MKNSENIIYAPIEIESAEQLHDLGYTWKDCRTWKIGVTSVKVLLVPADEATRDFLIQELQKKYKHTDRLTRCRIPGVRQAFIVCPECNRCDSCHYGKSAEDREPCTVSLDQLLEDGFEQGTGDVTSERALDSAELESILHHLNEANRDFVQIVKLRAAGYTMDQTAKIMGLSRATVFRYLKQIREIASA